MQPKVGSSQTEGDDHASIHDVRGGFSGIRSHVECGTSRDSQRRPSQEWKSVLYVFALAGTGRPVWRLGRLPAAGKRGRSAQAQASLLPLTAPSQRMRRSFRDRVVRWTF